MRVNEVITIDCLKGLEAMNDKSVDFVFSDPPYNRGKDYEVYDDNLPVDEYFDWMARVIKQIKRVSINGFALLINHRNLKRTWDIIPEAELVIIHRRAIGGYDARYFRMIRPLLCTAVPVKRSYDLWNDVRFTSEGYYFKEERFPHPAYTSQSLTRKVILTFTRKDDFVLDPFNGIGTTSVICKRYERKFLGFDINPRYNGIAENRLEKTFIELSFDEWF